jgi:TatD DNase family protein
MIIDTHAHLFDPVFQNDLPEVLQRATDAGVEAIVVPATNIQTSREAIELAERYPQLYACVGVHPHAASPVSERDFQDLESLLTHPKVIAVGEIGLDYYYNFCPKDKQLEVFRRQLEIAAKADLPVVIHTRDSMQDAISIVFEYLEKYPQWREKYRNPHDRLPYPKGVFHCYSGDAETAYKLVHRGFYISIPGSVTFKKQQVKDVVKKIGYDHILLETDAPYLTPEPFRGKRNEPAYIRYTCKAIADLFGISEEDVARASRFSTKKLFRIGAPERPTIAYRMHDALYLNMTNRCSADCIFCDRRGDAVVKGHVLKLENEPSVAELIAAIGDPKQFREVVFCGYGEPTIRLDEVKEVAGWIKQNGGRTRLNTNGHGNIIHHRQIESELKGLLDSVSISLNSTDPEEYGRLMQVDGKTYFQAMIDFVRQCKIYVPEVTMTVVDIGTIDIDNAQKFVEEFVGVGFKVRHYF